MHAFTCESFKDARAERYFDVFPNFDGQITVSIVAPGQVSGWHRHLHQTDHWFVIRGRLKVATIDEDGIVDECELTGPAGGRVITIRPGLWHGWRSYDTEVVILYHLNQKHDERDEIRATADELYERYGYRL